MSQSTEKDAKAVEPPGEAAADAGDAADTAASREGERPFDPDHPDRVGHGVDILEDDIAAAHEARIHELEARLRAVSAAFQQKQDEMAGVRDRLHRQAAVQEEIRRGEVVMNLFEPVENLLRSLDALKGHPAEQGLRMVYAQFMDALKRLGLEEVPGAGSRFDPNMHEALSVQPVDDKSKDNVVVAVFSTGYRFGNRLIRPARVVIGSYTGGENAEA